LTTESGGRSSASPAMNSTGSFTPLDAG